MWIAGAAPRASTTTSLSGIDAIASSSRSVERYLWVSADRVIGERDHSLFQEGHAELHARGDEPMERLGLFLLEHLREPGQHLGEAVMPGRGSDEGDRREVRRELLDPPALVHDH